MSNRRMRIQKTVPGERRHPPGAPFRTGYANSPSDPISPRVVPEAYNIEASASAPLVAPLPPVNATVAPSRGENSDREGSEPGRRVTTGLFLVPDLPAAIGPTLQIFVRNFAEEAAEITFTVVSVAENGVKRPLRTGTLLIPAEGFSRILLPARQLQLARLVEVNLELPRPDLIPTVAQVHSFLADDSTRLALWIAPSDFTPQAPN